MNEMNPIKIGEILTNLRGDKTREEVASAVNISTSALAMYETGNRIPRDNIKIRLARYYQKPIGDIFYASE